MDYRETLDYINSVRLNQWKLGLSRTRELLSRLGDPQKELRFVHVGGTNGKGSTCAMLESVMRAAGFRTGIFPSPFIEEFRERIQVDGEMIPEDDLCRITEMVKAEADRMEDEPSHFEIVTAIGMLYFRNRKCDIVVLEVGLGGEFDATNIIDPPEASVLTNIGFDHTEYLGNTLAEIARTKAGIIKTGSPAVIYPNVPEVMDVLKGICDERGCEMRIADLSRLRVRDAGLSGQTISWAAGGADAPQLSFRSPLLGDHQANNAAVALTVTEVLRERGWKIPEEAVIRGMESVVWPARFELLGRDPVFILDGGHNLQCAEAVAAAVRKYLPDTKITLLTGMLADKDYRAAVDVLLPLAGECYTVTPESSRALPGGELARFIRSRGGDAEYFEDTKEAVRKCMSGERPVLAFGSLYMAGEVRKIYRSLSNKSD